MTHQVIAYDPAGRDVAEVLVDWESRSRAVSLTGRTGQDPQNAWLVTLVGARGRDWGRLVLLESEGAHGHEILLERAATTLALGRLVERDVEALSLQVHGGLIAGLASSSLPSRDMALEARAVGVPLEGRNIIGVSVRLQNEVEPVLERQAALRALAESASRAASMTSTPALVGFSEGNKGLSILLSLARDADIDATLTGWVAALRGQARAGPVVIGVGPTVREVPEARKSLMDANRVSEAALGQLDARPYFVSRDLRLRGLLQVLAGSPELQGYAEREIGPLLDYDRRHGTVLMMVLRAYLEAGRNKTAAAKQAHVSRPWMYEQLGRVERVLGVSLDNEEVAVSLQVALMAWDAMRD